MSDEEEYEARKAEWAAKDAARAPGWYWVKHRGEWEVAKWSGDDSWRQDRWLMVDDWVVYSYQLDEISEVRLEPPTE